MNKCDWAKNLLLDPMFQEIMNDMESREMNRWANSDQFDFDTRHCAYTKLCAIREFKAEIESLAHQNEIERKRLKIF
jgi:hypothetical protein